MTFGILTLYFHRLIGYISTLRNNVRSRAWGAAIGCSYYVERCCIVKVIEPSSYSLSFSLLPLPSSYVISLVFSFDFGNVCTSLWTCCLDLLLVSFDTLISISVIYFLLSETQSCVVLIFCSVFFFLSFIF